MNDISVIVQPNIAVSAVVAMQGPPGGVGATGLTVVSATINGSGHLIFTLSNSSTIDAGLMPSPDLSGYLTKAAVVEVVSGTTYTLQASDNGKIKIFTSATGCVVTIPASPTGFVDFFQSQLWNQSGSAVNVSLSGTIVATGSNIAQKKSAMILLRSSTFYAAGGLS